MGALTGTLLAGDVVGLGDRRYRLIAEAETQHDDAGGIPDVFERPDDHVPVDTFEERSERHRQPHGDLSVASSSPTG